MKAHIHAAGHFINEHVKEIIGYGGIGFVGYKFWQDFVIPIIVAAICAAVGATIQHFVKRYWQKRETNQIRYKKNGVK